MEILLNPEVWASLLTLTALEIVLGIDNVIVLAILSDRLPAPQRAPARRIGLGLALIMRLMLLSLLFWGTRLEGTIFTLFGQDVSWRDVILIVGGLFLLAKSTQEIHGSVEGEGAHMETRAAASFGMVIVQIGLLDLVFSVDSVITAIGLARELPVMVTAIVIAMGGMLIAGEGVSGFVQRHPTVKMLALSYLLLVGMALIADGIGFHIPRGYLYAAMGFSAFVELLNIIARQKQDKSAPPRQQS